MAHEVPAKFELGETVQGPGGRRYIIKARRFGRTMWGYTCEEVGGKGKPVELNFVERMLNRLVDSFH